MKLIGMLGTALCALSVTAALSQVPPPPAGQRTGPGMKAEQDEREPAVLKTCKIPPPAAVVASAAAAPVRETAPTGPVTSAEIPGVIAAGQRWQEVWTVEGNNADGIVATRDGGLLLAQNDRSNVVKLDKDGKASIAYAGLNTSGSVAMNAKGALFVANRGLNPSIEQLAPNRKLLANKMPNGDPLDCLGPGINDLTAASNGGVYVTTGGLLHVDPRGKVTPYGDHLHTNGIVLSPDETHLFVTNGPSLVVFDVQKDGSLRNQRLFAKWDGAGGDGSTFDSAGRIYVTAGRSIRVISPDGQALGVIPTPRGVLSVTFSGPDRKTLYAVSRAGNTDWIIAIKTIAQGADGRGK